MLSGFLYGKAFEQELQYRKVYRYLDKYCGQYTEEDSSEFFNKNVKVNKTIWIAWLQGMECAPKMIRRCYASVKANVPKDFDVVLITSENMAEYIKLPDYIEEKYEKGIISKTHLSDIIRTVLLCAYGGCWLDATVYCSGSIPDYMVNSELFAFRWSLLDQSTLMISSWWLCAQKGQSIMQGVRSMLYYYWKYENKLRNYFLFHIMFSKVVNQNGQNKSAFYRIPYFNNSMPHVLYRQMAMEFDEKKWNIIKQNSPVHKLTYKEKYIQGDIYSFYMALLEGNLI